MDVAQIYQYMDYLGYLLLHYHVWIKGLRKLYAYLTSGGLTFRFYISLLLFSFPPYARRLQVFSGMPLGHVKKFLLTLTIDLPFSTKKL